MPCIIPKNSLAKKLAPMFANTSWKIPQGETETRRLALPATTATHRMLSSDFKQIHWQTVIVIDKFNDNFCVLRGFPQNMPHPSVEYPLLYTPITSSLVWWCAVYAVNCAQKFEDMVGTSDCNPGIPGSRIPGFRTIFQSRNPGIQPPSIPGFRDYKNY